VALKRPASRFDPVSGHHLYLLRDGKNKTISAKTRSWDKAEQQAQEIRESWDPVKQKLRELDELKQAQELGEVTIAYALECWLTSAKADSDSGNSRMNAPHQLVRLCDDGEGLKPITPAALPIIPDASKREQRAVCEGERVGLLGVRQLVVE
jgi:hypothetical protein